MNQLKNHPAMYVAGMFALVVVCRVTETIPLLSALPLGDLTAGTTILLLLVIRAEKKAKFFATPNMTLVSLLGLLIALSGLYSIWPGKSFQFVTSSGLITAILVVAITKTIWEPRHIRWYSWMLILGAVLFVINGVFNATWAGRVKVQSAYDPNDLALFLVTVLPLVLAELSLATTAAKRASLVVLATLMLLLTILTQSRGGFVALVATTLSLIMSTGFRLESGRSRFGRWMRSIAAISLATVVIAILAPSEVWERIGTVFQISDDYNVVSTREGRLAIWKRGMEYLVTHPWGAGVGAYPFVDSIMGGQFRTAHNSFVQVAVEIGLLGIALLISIIYRSYSGLKDVSRRIEKSHLSNGDLQTYYAYALGLRLALVAFCVAGFFLSFGYSPLLYMLIVLASTGKKVFWESVESAPIESKNEVS